MSSLPEEIYLQILSRVPVKSTFVCKCVCKSWFSLISDPSFAKKHLDFTPHRNISSNLMVAGLDDTNSSMIINSVSFDSLQPSLPERKEFIEMRYPYESIGYGVQILGSCNGLVCLVFNDDDAIFHGHGEFFFCIWNPATREYKRIDIESDRIDLIDMWMHAFGYDHKNDDYKLVIGVDSKDGNNTAVYVYTIQSDSWRSTISVPYNFCSSRKTGVLINGEFHFLAYTGLVKLIVSLDISEERFKEIQLPIQLKSSRHCSTTEAVLDGCLCVLTLFTDTRRNIDADDRRPPCVEVWVMQDYGVHKSWTKRYIISHEVITSRIMSDFAGILSFRFISSSKNGEILLMMRRKLIIYDPKDGSTVELDMGSVTRFSFGVSYFESLVSVNSGIYVGQEQIEESIEPEEA